jgi:hypothetical protein
MTTTPDSADGDPDTYRVNTAAPQANTATLRANMATSEANTPE